MAAEEAVMLIMGDSLSAGYGIRVEESWPTLLAQRLAEQGYPYRVVNASISGETTSGGARRISALLVEHKPHIVVLALGANDGLRGLDPGEVRRNVDHMVAAAISANSKAVLLRVRIPPNYGPQYLDQFERVFEQVADARKIILAPFMLEHFAIERSAFQRDGLHPTAAAQARILDTLWPTLAGAMDANQSADSRP